ncbi:RNA-processing protein [Candidatus Bathyarchaeota archaeon]|nr:RNA-processing protein [Candidatus Bathyarchaeota archaeon]
MTKASTFLKIPTERIGVLIGPNGAIKKHIENTLLVKLEIESETGGIAIALAENAEDPSSLFKAKSVVTAIGRGFSPELAFRLIRNEEASLDIIDLRVIFGRSESDIRRVKGRIIGMGGKTRRIIEELTETNVSIYGHTIGLIGDIEQIQAAREAIKMLIRGSQHTTVYRFLHRKRRELKKKMLELWEKPAEK